MQPTLWESAGCLYMPRLLLGTVANSLESSYTNVATLRICAGQSDLQLRSRFNDFVSSISFDHFAFTEKTSFFHLNQK